MKGGELPGIYFFAGRTWMTEGPTPGAESNGSQGQ
jgi:hypothetical protein